MNSIVFFTCMILILVICGFGLIGNFLSALVLIQKEMKSSTNYFLLGLTFSDILLLLLSFIRTLNNLHLFLGSDYSTLNALNTFLFLWDWTCTSGTRYFTVVVSLERFIAVCFPLKARVWMSPERSRNYALGVVVFDVLLAIFALLYTKYFNSYGFDIFAALTLHFVPFVLIAVLNTFIYFGVQKFKKNRKQLTRSETKDISVTKMLLCVVLVFGICHSFEIARRIMNYANYFDFVKYKYYDYAISYMADVFYVLNSSVNFLIYYFMVEAFRREFLKLVNTFLVALKIAKPIEAAASAETSSSSAS